MKIRRHRFNIYLVALLGVVLLSGCETESSKRKHPLSSLRVHQEIRPNSAGTSEEVSVFREHPVRIVVDKTPFVTEANVKQAKVMDAVGGFVLSIEFDKKGTWLLEQFSSATRGKHILIYCQFVNPNESKINKGRWLAAPRIKGTISDGLLVFTPDATREEAQQIAAGLNEVAKKLETGKELNW
jgi:preprotein translocase subunit SecD